MSASHKNLFLQRLFMNGKPNIESKFSFKCNTATHNDNNGGMDTELLNSMSATKRTLSERRLHFRDETFEDQFFF